MSNIRMVSITKQQDLPQALSGIVSFQIENDKVEAVIVKVGDEYIRVTKSEAYSSHLRISKEQGKILVKKFALKGKYLGMVDVYEEFDDKYTAQEKQTEYCNKANLYTTDETGLTIEEIEVEVDPDKIG